MDNFKLLADTLINGTAVEVKEAKKAIKKMVDGDRDWCKNNRDVYFAILDDFDRIKVGRSQAAFIDGTSIFFLSLGDDHFERLKDFTLRALQSPNGYVREAIRKASDWLYVSLTSGDSGKKARQYLQYVRDLEALISKYPDNSRAKYIHKMPPSVNKSLQMVRARIVESPAYFEILDKFAPAWIKDKRKKICLALELAIAKNNLEVLADFEVDNIRRIIFFEQNGRVLSDVLEIINPKEADLKDALALCNDAWNYFPHDLLGGKCPAEAVRELKINDREFPQVADAPMWQEMEDVPNVSLSLEDGKLVLEGAEENNLFDNKTLIGTRAGGKNGKLRFYFIFTPAHDMEFSKGLAARFRLAAKKIAGQYDCDLEEMEIEKDYALITILIPFNVAPGRFGDKILKTIGKGREKLIRNHYFSGNVSKPGLGEIKDYLAYLNKENI